MSVIADRLLADEPEARQTTRSGTLSIPALETRIVSGAEWDATIADFDEVCQEQLHAFAVSRWPSVVQEPMLFLANGEVVGGSLMMVQRLPLGLGKIAQPLRDCLLTAVDTLAVPRFSGRVVVRYPLVTERETLPSQIELAPEISKEVDRLTGE